MITAHISPVELPESLPLWPQRHAASASTWWHRALDEFGLSGLAFMERASAESSWAKTGSHFFLLDPDALDAEKLLPVSTCDIT